MMIATLLLAASAASAAQPVRGAAAVTRLLEAKPAMKAGLYAAAVKLTNEAIVQPRAAPYTPVAQAVAGDLIRTPERSLAAAILVQPQAAAAVAKLYPAAEAAELARMSETLRATAEQVGAVAALRIAASAVDLDEPGEPVEQHAARLSAAFDASATLPRPGSVPAVAAAPDAPSGASVGGAPLTAAQRGGRRQLRNRRIDAESGLSPFGPVKSFSLAEIVSVMTQMVFTPKPQIAAYAKLVQFVLGFDLPEGRTLDALDRREEAGLEIRRQYPELLELIQPTHAHGQEPADWLKAREGEYGRELPLVQLNGRATFH